MSLQKLPTKIGKLAGRPTAADAIGARVAAFLRRRHPTKTAMNVAAATGLSPTTAKMMIERRGAPSFATLGRLLSAYGPALLAEALDNPPEWLREAARQSDRTDRESGRDGDQVSGL